jgi:methyl-accepting chemotaxis protein
MKTVSQSLDLTHVAHIERRDEIGDTAAAFNLLLKRVAETIAVVRHSSDAVSVASNQIAVGNLDLSARTEQQAASLEETAASMDELTEIVKHNAQNACEASVLVVEAAKIVQDGNEAVGQVVNTMERVSKSAGKITDIIGVIEDLGFQTNILALNAAVEAARAGESGRGFAVVASEVRNLAQRSSTSAKEIRALITASVQGVHEGSTLAESAGATMTRAMQAVTRVNHIVAEIARASAEQTQGIEQINQAVTQMDGATQQNAALVEQSAAAAQSLAGQGLQLSDAVKAFRLDVRYASQAEQHSAV